MQLSDRGEVAAAPGAQVQTVARLSTRTLYTDIPCMCTWLHISHVDQHRQVQLTYTNTKCTSGCILIPFVAEIDEGLLVGKTYTYVCIRFIYINTYTNIYIFINIYINI